MSEKRDFESLLKELETIVKALEDKTISLEKSIDLYQKGQAISKELNQLLEAAEQVVLETVKP